MIANTALNKIVARGVKIPAQFHRLYLALRRISKHDCKSRIRNQEPAIKNGDYRSARYIVYLVISSGYNREVMAAAKEVLGHIQESRVRFNFPYISPHQQFGFNETREEPFFLGVLYELLPQNIAQSHFRRLYYDHCNSPNLVNQILLSFSSAESAAKFARGLWETSRDKTDLYLSNSNPTSQGYEFQRYEKDQLIKYYRRLKNAPTPQLTFDFLTPRRGTEICLHRR